MTEPITTKMPAEKKIYVQAEGGAYKAMKGKANLNAGVLFGGEIEKKGTYLKGEIGYGTAFKAGVEAGHQFDWKNNMGLELSANAQYLRDNSESKINNTVNVNGYGYSFSNKWNDGYAKAGVSGMFTFEGKKGSIKAGVEGGYRTNFASNVNHNVDLIVKPQDKPSVNYNTSFKGKEEGVYITPKVSAELNLGKKGNWSLIADADIYQGKAGIRYTF